MQYSTHNSFTDMLFCIICTRHALFGYLTQLRNRSPLNIVISHGTLLNYQSLYSMIFQQISLFIPLYPIKYSVISPLIHYIYTHIYIYYIYIRICIYICTYIHMQIYTYTFSIYIIYRIYSIYPIKLTDSSPRHATRSTWPAPTARALWMLW